MWEIGDYMCSESQDTHRWKAEGSCQMQGTWYVLYEKKLTGLSRLTCEEIII